MNLYTISDEITKAYESAVDPETGEIVDLEAYEALDCLQMDFKEKAEGILLWIKELKAKAEALKKEKQAFEARQKAAENRAESLKRYVSGVLYRQKFETEKVAVTWRKSEATEFHGDIQCLPKECLTYKAPELNKTELKKLLKQGEKIEGAELVEKWNIQIK